MPHLKNLIYTKLFKSLISKKNASLCARQSSVHGMSVKYNAAAATDQLFQCNLYTTVYN